jgi:thymidylate synthase (FAD)
MKVRCLDESTGYFTTTTVRNVVESGVKPVFRVTLEDGKSITCTREHRFLTPDGWASLDAIAGGVTVTRSGVATWTNRDAVVMVNGERPYRNRAWLEDLYHRQGLSQGEIGALAGASPHTIRTWVRKHRLQKPMGSWTIGRVPWNKGTTYRGGWSHKPETRALFSLQKRGARNPQWRGGITTELQRRRIDACEQYRSFVLDRDHYTCRLCRQRRGANNLQVHHVLPVGARPDLVDDPTNMAALCAACHRTVNGRELDYVEQLGRTLGEIPAGATPRTATPPILLARKCHVAEIVYAGEQMTYDLEVDGPNHNFVANGIVTHNSQLSQRFVDESDTDFVEPDIIASDPELHAIWRRSVEQSHQAYLQLAEGLAAKVDREYAAAKRREKRIRARQAARSVLPNATETKVFMSANARALRHVIEYRGAPDAEPEIRNVAMALLRIMQEEAPNLFGDYEIQSLPDGSTAALTAHRKV